MAKSIKRQLTRQLILDKGLELFLRNGFDATSLDDILQTVELTKGAFYYHFDSKASFMMSIIKEIVSKKVYSELIVPLDEMSETTDLVFSSIEKTLLKLTPREKTHGFMLGNFINEFGAKDDIIASELKSILDDWKLGLVKCLQRGKTSGHISRHTDSEAVASFIISSYIGIRTLKKCDPDETLRYKYLSQLRNYLNSLRP